jgi:hypothetical protein
MVTGQRQPDLSRLSTEQLEQLRELVVARHRSG